MRIDGKRCIDFYSRMKMFLHHVSSTPINKVIWLTN
jgi:hypothetical protein